jgi:hypothetical protein
VLNLKPWRRGRSRSRVSRHDAAHLNLCPQKSWNSIGSGRGSLGPLGDEEAAGLAVDDDATLIGEEHGPEVAGFRVARPQIPESNLTYNEPPA